MSNNGKHAADRLHYMDNIRAFVMSIGVLVHAGEIYHFWLSWLIHFASGLFRMKLFVLIAGFFVGLLKARRGTRSLMKERLIRFGVPAVAAVILVNPIANYFYLNTYVGKVSILEFIESPFANNRAGFLWGDSAPIFLTWHLQIWFIITVLIFCMLMPVAFRIEQSTLFDRWKNLVLDMERRGFGALGLAISMAILAVVMRAGHFITSQQILGGGPFNFIAQTCWLYAPYFVIGIAIFRCDNLFQIFHRVRIIELSASVLVIVVGFILQPLIKARIGFVFGEIWEYFYQGFSGTYIIIAILNTFRRFVSKPSKVARYLSESSYTIYIFQMLLLSVIQFYLKNMGVSNNLNYWISIVVSYVGLIAIHSLIIDRNAVTRFMFNGKIWWNPVILGNGHK